MHGNRIERVQEEVRREIGAILQQRASDPRLTWLSVTRVEISSDLTFAKVYVSSLGDDEARSGAFKALQKAGPFIRSELGRRIQLRRVPELSFREDRGIEASLRINQLLAESKRDSSDTDANDAPAAAGRESANLSDRVDDFDDDSDMDEDDFDDDDLDDD